MLLYSPGLVGETRPPMSSLSPGSPNGDFMGFNGDLMGCYGDFMGSNGDLMGFYCDLMGFYGD